MKQITIAGRVTKNAEVKQFDTNSVVNFSVAVDDGYGENKSTLFFDCEYYRTGIADYLVKGTPVVAVGELKTREYNGKTYLKVKVQDIQMMGKAASSSYSTTQQNDQTQTNQDMDDEIPF